MRKVLKFALTVLCVQLSIHSLASWNKLKIEIEQNLNVTIIIDTSFHSTWEEVRYDSISDTVALNKYLQLLHFEYSKYPAHFFSNIGISNIVICQDLFYAGQNRAAIPDPYVNAIYLEVKDNYSEDYLIHVMHHELHHCTEYAIWKNMYHRWRKWSKANRFWFKYGQGGAATYEGENTKIDWYSFIHPKKGFLNLYATTGEEEDRCEVFALIMSDKERHFLIDICDRDRLLRKKVKLMLGILSGISGAENSYWDQKMYETIH